MSDALTLVLVFLAGFVVGSLVTVIVMAVLVGSGRPPEKRGRR